MHNSLRRQKSRKKEENETQKEKGSTIIKKEPRKSFREKLYVIHGKGKHVSTFCLVLVSMKMKKVWTIKSLLNKKKGGNEYLPILLSPLKIGPLTTVKAW